MLEGCCSVNVKQSYLGLVYNAEHMNENYRPIFPSEKKIWKIKNEPRIIESNPVAEWKEMQQRSAERQTREAPFWYLLLCGLLSWLNDFAIDGDGKRETPQDTLTAKS